MRKYQLVDASGGICAPRGFLAGAAAAGLKENGQLDIAVIYSERICSSAATFTLNKVKAAPVVISQLHLKQQRIQAVVANSGNANALTGSRGFRDALLMAKVAGDMLDLDPSQVIVASTGIIGRYLPIEEVTVGIRKAVSSLSANGSLDAAKAIMTTDRVPKQSAVDVLTHLGKFSVGAIAKGSGMIHPNMATMLCFITCDAAVPAELLQQLLLKSVACSFNRVSVDGCTSTNDMVVALANGASEVHIGPDSDMMYALQEALDVVCLGLAKRIAADGEGATKLICVNVHEASDDNTASKAARAVASSLLVKAAFYGNDPNWGRIIAALGQSGCEVYIDRLRVDICGVRVFDKGAPTEFDRERLTEKMRSLEVNVDIYLGDGNISAYAYGCDLSEEYVRINAEYTT